MAVAAYLHRVRRGEYGIEISSARRINGPGRFEFMFKDPQRKAHGLVIEFSNSESSTFDDGMRSIKTLLSSSGYAVQNTNGLYITPSMAIAAYFHRVRRGEHDVWIHSARKVNGPKRFEFAFKDPQHVAANMATEFSNSESAIFDDGMRSIKTLLSSSRQDR